MPLNPVKKSTITEIPVRGIIGISTNGVPAFGPQEAGNLNAVEPGTDAFITDAQVLTEAHIFPSVANTDFLSLFIISWY